MIYLRQSTASQEIPLGYFLDSTDGNTEETGLTIANTDIKLWKAGATTLANKNSGGATHISNGIYYAVLDATDTDTLGSLVIFIHVTGALSVRLECVVLDELVYDSMIAASDNLQVDLVQWLGTAAATPTVAGVPEVDVTHWLGTASATPTVAGVPEVDVTHINGGATSGNNATLSLAQLNIVNSGGSAIVASSTGSNGHGIAASGNGSGAGLSATGGATGYGINGIGGSSSGDGMRVEASAGTNSNGLAVLGKGSGRGISAEAAATGAGIYVVSGSGRGIDVSVAAGNNSGVVIAGSGTGHGIAATGGSTGHGIRAAGQGSGEGISAIGGSTGHGIEAIGGATSGNAINATATAGNGHGLNVAGQGSGHGLSATGGATGNGVQATGGATSGDGINAAAPTSGDGMELVGAGGGFDLNADIQGGVSGTVNANVTQISGDSTAADNAESFFDGTGYAGTNNVIPTVTTVTNQVTANVTAVSGDAGAADNLEADYDGTGYNKSASTIGTATALSSTERTNIADALLKRDWTAVTGEAARSVLNALRAIRNKVALAAGTMTVYEEDDSTTAWTAAVTTDAAADPITEVDPT